MLAFGVCSGCGVYRVGVLFHSCRSPLWLAIVWLEVTFLDRVGVGEFMVKVFKLESNFPMRMYLRCILYSISAWVWVCRIMGMVPWYMVYRLTSSTCIPHVHPSVWEGMLLMATLGMVVRVFGGAIGSPEYH
jgi:hypothetical protein